MAKKKLRKLTIEKDNISITIKDGMVEYLQTLIDQSLSPIIIKQNIDVDGIKLLLDSRKIYTELYGFQFNEEKEWISRLINMFNAIS